MQKRKLIAMLLALAMVMAFAMPALAAPMASDGTLTITPPANHVLSEAANQFSAYKLYNVVRISGTTPNLKFVYEPAPAVENFLKAIKDDAASLAKYGITTNPGTDLAAACEEFRQYLQKFDGTGGNLAYDDEELIALAKLMVQSKGVEPFTQQKTAGKTSIQFTGLDYGWYLVLGEGTHEEGGHTKTTISRGMLVNVPELCETSVDPLGWTKHSKRTLKIDVPTIKKEVEEDQETTNPADDTWEKETDKNIGDTINYKITSAVPDMTGYDGYTFKVSDQLSKGLTFKTTSATTNVKDDVKVTIGGANYTAFNAYLYNAGNLPSDLAGKVTLGTDEHLLFIDFTGMETNMKTFMALTKGLEIVITYSAILNEKAVIGKPGNPNKVILEYARNPDVIGACDVGETPPDETIVYTFDINLLKVDGEDKTTPLAGAEFELKRTATGESLWFNWTETGNLYTLSAVQPGTGTTKTLKTYAAGSIKIEGLDEGTYYLVETKAPIGYNLPEGNAPFVFEIVHTSKGDYTVNDFVGASHQCKVPNYTGGILPGTGGSGTYVFFGVGIGLAVLLAAAFVIYKRKRTLGMLSA